MRVAVLTLTRDRLDYTRHCFARLDQFAGCTYDHYVLDQASTDATQGWLRDWHPFTDGQNSIDVTEMPYNVGISRGMNLLLDEAVNPDDYDVIVKFDNDCELTQPNTLRDVCRLALEGGALLSPRILGLQNPPRATRELRIGEEIIEDVPQIGGIFLAAPAYVYGEMGFRFNESNPYWGMDDVQLCAWWRDQGGTCGYVKRLEAWHYLGTDGQRKDQADYFARKDAEYAAA